MYKLLLSFIAFLFSTTIIAAERDSFHITVQYDKWYVQHTVKPEETIFTIARRYHVPPATLANVNGVDYRSVPAAGTTLYIPLGAYNHLTSEPLNADDGRKLYYAVAEGDNLQGIARHIGVSQRMVQQWNNMPDNMVTPGQELLAGWILYDNTTMGGLPHDQLSARGGAPTPPPQPKPSKPITETQKLPDGTVLIPMPPKQPVDTIPPAKKMFLEQVAAADNDTTSERGSAAFFDSPGSMKVPNMFYGFHSGVKKGTIIEVYNPAADKTVYVKVLGPVPGTKQYYNSIMGINSMAREALGVVAVESKVWCEIKYAGKPIEQPEKK